jgi:hypothetical protein
MTTINKVANCNHKEVITFFGPFCTTTTKDDIDDVKRMKFFWSPLLSEFKEEKGNLKEENQPKFGFKWSFATLD